MQLFDRERNEAMMSSCFERTEVDTEAIDSLGSESTILGLKLLRVRSTSFEVALLEEGVVQSINEDGDVLELHALALVMEVELLIAVKVDKEERGSQSRLLERRERGEGTKHSLNVVPFQTQQDLLEPLGHQSFFPSRFTQVHHSLPPRKKTNRVSVDSSPSHAKERTRRRELT